MNGFPPQQELANEQRPLPCAVSVSDAVMRPRKWSHLGNPAGKIRSRCSWQVSLYPLLSVRQEKNSPWCPEIHAWVPPGTFVARAVRRAGSPRLRRRPGECPSPRWKIDRGPLWPFQRRSAALWRRFANVLAAEYAAPNRARKRRTESLRTFLSARAQWNRRN